MGQLSETYTGARNLALITVSVITATSIASGTVGVSVMGLDMSQAPLVTVATVCLVMLFFAGFGLIMGWAHTTKKKRVQVSSRVDLAISGTVIVIGISYCIYLATNTDINISASPGLFAVFALCTGQKCSGTSKSPQAVEEGSRLRLWRGQNSPKSVQPIPK